MKLQSNIHWTPQTQTNNPALSQELQRVISTPLRSLMLTLGATVPAALIVILASWAVSTGAGNILGASLWGTAIVFMALTVESIGRRAMAFAATGLLLTVLAWMGANVMPEYGIVAAFVIAAWASFATVTSLRRL
jgi:hypothetical protein